MIVLLILVFAVLILYEVPGLIRNKQWRELAVYSVLISLAFTISLLQTLNVKILNPVRDVQYFVSDILHLRYK